MDARRAWFVRQGLDKPISLTPAQAIERFGWLRSVGSANPYLAIHVRTGASRVEIEAAVAAVDIVEVPAARGCIYYVSRSDAALALKLARMTGAESGLKLAVRHLGVTEEEVAGLAEATMKVLDQQPADPRALAKELGGKVRNLGDEGKKRGQTTTLPLALGWLQVRGLIRRLPQGGRLDTERFHYAIWHEGPQPETLSDEEAAAIMATRFRTWASPASEADFRGFTGLPAKLSKPVADFSETPPDAPDQVGQTALIASLDPFLHLHRNISRIADPEILEKVKEFGNTLTDLDSHSIVVDGRLVGLWEFDSEVGEIVAWTFGEHDPGAILRISEWIREELGDFRSFSLDSPASRKPRLERLRALHGST